MSPTPSKYRENCVFLLLEEMSLHGHGQFAKYTIVDLPYSVQYACSLLSMAKQINKQNKKSPCCFILYFAGVYCFIPFISNDMRTFCISLLLKEIAKIFTIWKEHNENVYYLHETWILSLSFQMQLVKSTIKFSLSLRCFCFM